MTNIFFRPLAIILLFSAASSSFAQLTFAPSGTYSAPGNPLSVVTADVNGDGSQDYISANYSSNSLSVFTNNGHGLFTLGSKLTAATFPRSVLAVDINGDHHPDLIAANDFTNILSVFTNNGHGGFTPAPSIVVGNSPWSVAAADVNGDGAMDLISANEGDNTLSVMTNNGAGTFATAQTLAIRSFSTLAIFVTAADVNGDGKPDLICVNYSFLPVGTGQSPGSVAVFTNAGNGTFVFESAPLTTAYPDTPTSVAAVDVNGDGHVDLVCSHYATNILSVLTNDSTGHFNLSSTVAVGSGQRSVTAADLNSDGKIDLIAPNMTPGTLSVLTNDGLGNFTVASTLTADAQPVCVAAADINKDGQADLICANNSASSISVFVNEPTLAVQSPGAKVSVSWPSHWTNWTLLQNRDLTTTNWTPSSGVLDDGTNHNLNLPLPPPTNSLFFRLRLP